MNAKHVLVAISGGIAAYKACDLVSKLSREFDVKVMMTPNAVQFVSPLTFAALSHHEVYIDEFHCDTPIPHIDLAKWADVLIAAPASANLIAKAVCGIADNLVTSAFLACTCPKILCPAMNEHMLENPVTQSNIKKASGLGWKIVMPDTGHLACMDNGKGRLPDTPVLINAVKSALSGNAAAEKFTIQNEPDLSLKTSLKTSENSPASSPDTRQAEKPGLHAADLFELSAGSLKDPDNERIKEKLDSLTEENQEAMDTGTWEKANEKLYDDALDEIKPLQGLHVLISAGPTIEKLDPVRYITNHSSGKQGYAIAKDAGKWGAEVRLVHGPVSLEDPAGIEMIPVETAAEMEKAMCESAAWADFIIMSAAVADYRPKEASEQKIKKSDETMLVEFVRNPDILKELGQDKRDNQVLCGFAMETENLDQNAKAKLKAKNCDLLIANSLTVPGAGFQSDTNIVSLLRPDSIEHLPIQSKEQLGYQILAEMLEIWKGRNHACMH